MRNLLYLLLARFIVMLGRLLSMLKERPRVADEKAKEPRPDDRGIFRFFDGIDERNVDPLEIWERIWTHPEKDFAHLVQDVETIDPEKQPKAYFEAQRDFVAFVREIFGLESFEAGGLTYQEIRDLIGNYLYFMDDLKKKHAPWLTGSAPTDSSPASDSPPSSESDSISTKTESTSESPIASATE